MIADPVEFVYIGAILLLWVIAGIGVCVMEDRED